MFVWSIRCLFLFFLFWFGLFVFSYCFVEPRWALCEVRNYGDSLHLLSESKGGKARLTFLRNILPRCILYQLFTSRGSMFICLACSSKNCLTFFTSFQYCLGLAVQCSREEVWSESAMRREKKNIRLQKKHVRFKQWLTFWSIIYKL